MALDTLTRREFVKTFVVSAGLASSFLSPVFSSEQDASRKAPSLNVVTSYSSDRVTMDHDESYDIMDVHVTPSQDVYYLKRLRGDLDVVFELPKNAAEDRAILYHTPSFEKEDYTIRIAVNDKAQALIYESNPRQELIRLHDLKTGRIISSIKMPYLGSGKPISVNDIAKNPADDNFYLSVTSGPDSWVDCFDITTGKLTRTGFTHQPRFCFDDKGVMYSAGLLSQKDSLRVSRQKPGEEPQTFYIPGFQESNSLGDFKIGFLRYNSSLDYLVLAGDNPVNSHIVLIDPNRKKAAMIAETSKNSHISGIDTDNSGNIYVSMRTDDKPTLSRIIKLTR